MEPGLEATTFFNPGNFVFPFGVHIAVVEVDADTGHATVLRYVAVDDFGTGYSSLVSFSESAFDGLKIDRGFIHDLESNARHRAIVRTIAPLPEPARSSCSTNERSILSAWIGMLCNRLSEE